MRAVRIHEEGGPEVVLVDRDVPVPEPGRGEALVRLRASALNRIDIWVRLGKPSRPKPHTLGADGAGVVEALGPDTEGPEPGTAVVINPGLFCGACEACLRGQQSLCERFAVLGEHVAGTHADYVVVPVHNLHPKPEPLSFAEAAAYPLVFATAWRMLMTRARLQPGEWVLVWGAGSGVGSAAVTLASALGARVIATASHDDVLAVARDIGRALECYGHIKTLRREAVGSFGQNDMISLEQLTELCHRAAAGEGNLADAILPVETALDDIPALAVARADAARLQRGQAVLLRGRDAPIFRGTVYVTVSGQLVALAEVDRGEIVPKRVFNLAGVVGSRRPQKGH